VDPNRIIPILNALAQIWSSRPNMTLGDLILTAIGCPGVQEKFTVEKRLRELPDDVLVQTLAEYYKPISNKDLHPTEGKSD